MWTLPHITPGRLHRRGSLPAARGSMGGERRSCLLARTRGIRVRAVRETALRGHAANVTPGVDGMLDLVRRLDTRASIEHPF